jgi:hypothetical protein
MHHTSQYVSRLFLQFFPELNHGYVAATADRYCDLIWERIEGPYSQLFDPHLHCGHDGRTVSPEVWTRREGQFDWGTSHFWTHVDILENIDGENNVIDIVNVESIPNIEMTKNYFVLSWNENGRDVAFPLGEFIHMPVTAHSPLVHQGLPQFSIPPRFCCDRRCQILRRHLTTLPGSSRRIEFVGRIGSKSIDRGILDKVFDTTNFRERSHDIFIKYEA